MIFALIGEQFGFLGALVLLGGYLVLFAAGIESPPRPKNLSVASSPSASSPSSPDKLF